MLSEEQKLELEKIKGSEIDSFARFIRLKRLEKGMSMRALAKKTGLSNPTISKYESGVKKNPNITALIKLGIELDFTLNDIGGYF
jgi:transcriptional regulator with XRE-family HTH domain